jgi:hypothetical protein
VVSGAGASVGSGAGASVGSGAGASVGSTAGALVGSTVGLAVGGAFVASSFPQAASKGKATNAKINKPMMDFFIFPLLFNCDFLDICIVSCYVPKSIALFLLSFIQIFGSLRLQALVSHTRGENRTTRDKNWRSYSY